MRSITETEGRHYDNSSQTIWKRHAGSGRPSSLSGMTPTVGPECSGTADLN